MRTTQTDSSLETQDNLIGVLRSLIRSFEQEEEARSSEQFATSAAGHVGATNTMLSKLRRLVAAYQPTILTTNQSNNKQQQSNNKQQQSNKQQQYHHHHHHHHHLINSMSILVEEASNVNDLAAEMHFIAPKQSARDVSTECALCSGVFRYKGGAKEHLLRNANHTRLAVDSPYRCVCDGKKAPLSLMAKYSLTHMPPQSVMLVELPDQRIAVMCQTCTGCALVLQPSSSSSSTTTTTTAATTSSSSPSSSSSSSTLTLTSSASFTPTLTSPSVISISSPPSSPLPLPCFDFLDNSTNDNYCTETALFHSNISEFLPPPPPPLQAVSPSPVFDLDDFAHLLGPQKRSLDSDDDVDERAERPAKRARPGGHGDFVSVYELAMLREECQRMRGGVAYQCVVAQADNSARLVLRLRAPPRNVAFAVVGIPELERVCSLTHFDAVQHTLGASHGIATDCGKLVLYVLAEEKKYANNVAALLKALRSGQLTLYAGRPDQWLEAHEQLAHAAFERDSANVPLECGAVTPLGAVALDGTNSALHRHSVLQLTSGLLGRDVAAQDVLPELAEWHARIASDPVPRLLLLPTSHGGMARFAVLVYWHKPSRPHVPATSTAPERAAAQRLFARHAAERLRSHSDANASAGGGGGATADVVGECAPALWTALTGAVRTGDEPLLRALTREPAAVAALPCIIAEAANKQRNTENKNGNKPKTNSEPKKTTKMTDQQAKEETQQCVDLKSELTSLHNQLAALVLKLDQLNLHVSAEPTTTELTKTELATTELTTTELTTTELTTTELTTTELTNTELTNTELTNTELTNTELTTPPPTTKSTKSTKSAKSTPSCPLSIQARNRGDLQAALEHRIVESINK